jgi:hypothetical protein
MGEDHIFEFVQAPDQVVKGAIIVADFGADSAHVLEYPDRRTWIASLITELDHPLQIGQRRRKPASRLQISGHPLEQIRGSSRLPHFGCDLDRPMQGLFRPADFPALPQSAGFSLEGIHFVGAGCDGQGRHRPHLTRTHLIRTSSSQLRFSPQIFHVAARGP